MRQQQNNNTNNNNKNRMRGRNRNSSSKPSNTLNRNYESNGPDVKIRGNAAHIAEKYITLARDALSSGDRVVAENYLQHAEHYNRIVLAANAQREEYQAAQANNPRNNQNDDDDDQLDQSNDGSYGDNEDDDNDGVVDARPDQGQNRDQRSNNDQRPRRRDARGEPRAETRNDGRNESRNNRPNPRQANGNGNVSHDAGDAKEQVEVQVPMVASESPEAVEAAPKPRPRRTSRKKEPTAEGISPDAAGLPQGLLGGLAPREVAVSDE